MIKFLFIAQSLLGLVVHCVALQLGTFALKGPFTPGESGSENKEDKKNERQTSKKFFAFASAFSWCEWALRQTLTWKIYSM